jgi:hypothetical protein
MTGITLLTLAIATAAVENPTPGGFETLPADQKTVSTSSWDPDDHSMVGAIAGGATATLVTVAIPIILSATVGLDGFSPESLTQSPITQSQRLAQGIFLAGFLALVPMATWAGHRLGGGRGSLLSVFIGSTLGTLATIGVMIMAQPHSGLSDKIGDGMRAGIASVLAAGLPVTLSVTALQISHAHALIPQLNVTPVKGGATLSMGWNL